MDIETLAGELSLMRIDDARRLTRIASAPSTGGEIGVRILRHMIELIDGGIALHSPEASGGPERFALGGLDCFN